MSIRRLRERVPSARRLLTCRLRAHRLHFHKQGQDGSAKCDAFETENASDTVIGALFEICESERAALDRVEGLGYGYDRKPVILEAGRGIEVQAFTYFATHIDGRLKPYSWYKQHVLVGARESRLPRSYVSTIEAVEALEDPDRVRDRRQRAIHAEGSVPGFHEAAMEL